MLRDFASSGSSSISSSCEEEKEEKEEKGGEEGGRRRKRRGRRRRRRRRKKRWRGRRRRWRGRRRRRRGRRRRGRRRRRYLGGWKDKVLFRGLLLWFPLVIAFPIGAVLNRLLRRCFSLSFLGIMIRRLTVILRLPPLLKLIS